MGCGLRKGTAGGLRGGRERTPGCQGRGLWEDGGAGGLREEVDCCGKILTGSRKCRLELNRYLEEESQAESTLGNPDEVYYGVLK